MLATAGFRVGFLFFIVTKITRSFSAYSEAPGCHDGGTLALGCVWMCGAPSGQGLMSMVVTEGGFSFSDA